MTFWWEGVQSQKEQISNIRYYVYNIALFLSIWLFTKYLQNLPIFESVHIINRLYLVKKQPFF